MKEKEQKKQTDVGVDDFSLEDLPSLEEEDSQAKASEKTLNLEEYGIWVKGEPEEVYPADESLAEPVLEDLAGEEELSLNGTEERLETMSLESEGLNKIDLPEEEELPSFDDATLSQSEESKKSQESENLNLGREREESALVDFEEVSLDDLGIEISENLPEDLEKKAAEKESKAKEKATEEAKVHSDEDYLELNLSLEDEKEEPISLELDENIDDLSLSENKNEEPEKIEFELDKEKELTESFLEETSSESFGSLDEIAEIDSGQEVKEEVEKDEIEVSLSDEAKIEPDESEIEKLSVKSAMDSVGLPQSSLLAKIEEELRSIKVELNSLKSELGELRRGKAVEGETEDKVSEEAAFFEESSEEDETIALTGEELDNILTTAEIKETEVESKAEKPERIAEKVTEIEQSVEFGEPILSYEDEETMEEAPTEVIFSADEVESQELKLEEETLTEFEKEVSEEKKEDEIEIEIPEISEQEVETEETLPSIDLETPAELESVELNISDEITQAKEASASEEIEDLTLVEEEMPVAQSQSKDSSVSQLPQGLKEELKSVLGYMDQLLEALPEEKIEEFAKSEYFSIYKKLFEELGLVS